MTAAEVNELARGASFKGQWSKGTVEETHISWVVLTGDYVFKIKKPLKLSFLDFSTLELRRHFCERELELNSRFSHIYLSVEPIRKMGETWQVGDGRGELVDYAVVMKRMAIPKRLDNRVKKNDVPEGRMRAVARKIALFHRQAHKVYIPFDLAVARDTFNDLSSVGQIIFAKLDATFFDLIPDAIRWSDEFLERHASRFQQRIDQGLKRDVHGDLHTGNIFLYADPVVFDCIEFNDQYRQIDVLYEIAFLCMDLEASGHRHLAQVFLEEYKIHFPAFQSPEDELLFVYFKALRANIRAKVHAMSASQSRDAEVAHAHIQDMRRYLCLMNAIIMNPGTKDC
jgi:uncharacterized protein